LDARSAVLRGCRQWDNRMTWPRCAHRGYVLQTGRVVLSGTASELLGDQRIRDAYLGGSLAAETAS